MLPCARACLEAVGRGHVPLHPLQGLLPLHQLAKKGEKCISLPYVVKGMDVSIIEAAAIEKLLALLLCRECRVPAWRGCGQRCTGCTLVSLTILDWHPFPVDRRNTMVMRLIRHSGCLATGPASPGGGHLEGRCCVEGDNGEFHLDEGASLQAEWIVKLAEYEKKYHQKAAELKSIISGLILSNRSSNSTSCTHAQWSRYLLF